MKYVSPTIELEYLESSGDLMLVDSNNMHDGFTGGAERSFWDGQEGQE